MTWFDSHCHIHEQPDAVTLTRECNENGLGGLINIGTTIATSLSAITVTPKLATLFPDMVFGATAGIHPHDSDEVVEDHIFREFTQLVEQSYSNGGVVGIGECGLDFFYGYSSRENQTSVFIRQIELANSLNLPLVIHTRDAWDETFAILKSYASTPMIFHCFTGGTAELEKCLEFNSVVSFSGIVTFKKAENTAIAAKECPIERMIIETDSPYLSPVPYRGTKNIPHRVSVVGEYIATLKDVEASSIAKSTFANTKAIFGV